MALNPIAYWRLDESGGSSIIDGKAAASGTYHGTVEYGVEPIVEHSIGSAAGFEGSGSYGQIPHRTAFELAEGAISFAMAPDTVSGQQMLLAKDASGVVGGFTVDIQDGQLRAYIRGTDGLAAWLPSPSGAAPVAAAEAHHVVLTWGARGAELWLDGELKASRTEITNGIEVNTQDLFLAAYSTPGGPTAFADAVLDEVALFHRQLRGDQLSSMAKARSINHSAASEFVTTPEAHGWSEANSIAQNMAAFNAAIAAASANAATSGSGRGVVELTPGKVYTCMPSGNGANVNPAAAINITGLTPNVEIRTQGKPPVGGNQAILRFDNWSGYSGVHNRCILKATRGNNVVLGWLTLDGNKLSAGTTYSTRRTWLQTNVSYGFGGNGGIHNLAVRGGTAVRLYQIENRNAVVDGAHLRDDEAGGVPLTDFRVEDCDFHHCRRQALTIDRLQNTTAGFDNIVFLRCQFRDTGEQPDMPGEAPGSGVDVEPLFNNARIYGLTFDDCDISDNRGYTLEKGSIKGHTLGRGLAFDGTPRCQFLRVVNCRMERNRTSGLKVVNGNDSVVSFEDCLIQDNKMRDNGTEHGHPNFMEFKSSATKDGAVQFVNTQFVNNEFTINGSPSGGYYFDPLCADSGHSIGIFFGSFATGIVVIANGQTTITSFPGLPG